MHDVLLISGLALVLSSALTRPVIRVLARLRAVDMPTARSSHNRPTLRGGGLAPAVAVLVAAALSADLTGRVGVGLVVASGAFGIIGLLEDVVGVRLRDRFILQGAAALIALPFLVSGMSGSASWRLVFAVGTVLWMLSYVNAYNFMDGIDGLSVAQAVVAGGSWYLIGHARHAPTLAAGGLIVAAVALGFAPFNFPRSRVFLGDVGSYAIGGFLAALVVIGLRAGVRPEAVVAPVLLYLADTGSTLARRILSGETWYMPHCDHAYQRLVRQGWSHARTTLTVMAFMAACAGAGAVALTEVPLLRVLADAAVVVLLGSYLAMPGLLARRRPAAVLHKTSIAVG